MVFILDAYAWIEYFKGTGEGAHVGNILKKADKIITLECTISELLSYCLRNDMEFSRIYASMKSVSFIFPVTIDLWISAARVKAELRGKRQGFGLIDAILVAKQRELGAKLVTGDPHFKGMKDVILLG
jgi:predicted nucleic acid-binding protein